MSRVTLALCPGPLHGPPSAQSPFAHRRRYLRCRAVSPHVSRHYPTFIAPTGSCASPKPSSCLGVTLVHQVFAGRCQPRLGLGPSRRYLCRSVPTCLDPYSGCLQGAYTRYFPWSIGLPHVRTGSALGLNPDSDFSRGLDFGAAVIHSCSDPPVCSPPWPLLPSHPSMSGSRGFYVRAYHGSLPLRAADMLTVQTGQLTVPGLTPG